MATGPTQLYYSILESLCVLVIPSLLAVNGCMSQMVTGLLLSGSPGRTTVSLLETQTADTGKALRGKKQHKWPCTVNAHRRPDRWIPKDTQGW